MLLSVSLIFQEVLQITSTTTCHQRDWNLPLFLSQYVRSDFRVVSGIKSFTSWTEIQSLPLGRSRKPVPEIPGICCGFHHYFYSNLYHINHQVPCRRHFHHYPNCGHSPFALESAPALHPMSLQKSIKIALFRTGSRYERSCRGIGGQLRPGGRSQISEGRPVSICISGGFLLHCRW